MSWRRIVLLAIGFLLALTAGTWWFVQRSDAATQWVRRGLAVVFSAPTSIAAASIDLARGRLLLRGLTLMDPTTTGRALATVDTIHVDVTAEPLGALFAVHRVVVDGVALALGPDLPAAASLLRPRSGAASGPTSMPPIEIRRGSVRFTHAPGEPPLLLDRVQLDLTPLASEPSVAVVRGTARLAEFGAEATITGDIDLSTGAASFAVSTADVLCNDVLLQRLRRLLGLAPDAGEAGGRLRRATLLVKIPPAGPGPGEAELDLHVELDDVRVATPNVPRLVRAATVTLQANSRNDGTATARLVQATGSGRLDVTATAYRYRRAPQLELRVQGQGVHLDDDVLAALRTFQVGREVVAALRPTTGRADVDLFLRIPHQGATRAELEIGLREAAVSFHGFGDDPDRAQFPLPLVDASGRIRLRNDVLLLEAVEASIAPACGGGKVRLTGRIDTREASGEDTTLDIETDSAAFHPDLRSALNALLADGGELYDKFAPTGRTAITVQIRPRRELPGGWAVGIRPDRSTMQWAGFPYRLENLSGSVVARASGVDFDLAGEHGAGRLTMQGHIPVHATGGEDDPGFAAMLGLQDVAIDDDLRRAVRVLAAELDEPWQAAAPTGRLDGQVKVWRTTATADLQHDARLELDGVSLRLPVAPWRAIDLNGPLSLQGGAGKTRIDFDALRGQLDHGAGTPAQLALLGTLITGAASGNDLSFVARNLELDDQLGATLEGLGALGRGTWDYLAPSGQVDLVCRHERSTGSDDRLRLVVQLVDVRSTAAILPRPAEHMTGELTVANGELRFRDLRADLGGARVQCWDGRVRTRPEPDGRTEIGFSVRAAGMPIDDGIANLFTGPLRQAVLERRLDGRADVDGLRLEFTIPCAGSPLPFETMIEGQMRLYGVDMSLGEGRDGIRVEGISGVVTLAESRVTDTGGGLFGTLRNGSLRLFGQPFEALETSFRADAERLELDSLTSRCHGGTVRGAAPERAALRYLLPGPAAPEGRLLGDLTFARVDVFSFLATCGWANAPYSGSASGKITLQKLDGNRIVDAEAVGDLTIERADLGVVPLFTAIYAQLPVADRPRFNYLEAAWRLANGRLDFDQLAVRSDLLGATGTGSLEFDGYLDVEMTMKNLLGTSADPIFMPLIEELAKNLVRFHLFGHLRDLHAEKRWVTERSPSRRAVGPMAPEAPRPTAPAF